VPLLSCVIPSRNERYLPETVADLLHNAVGDIEILPVLDGPPFVPLPDDPRVKVIRHDTPQGMRPSINDGVAQAQGDYLLKCDAHCSFAPGFDRVLLDEIDANWVVVPRRYSLNPVTWERDLRDPPRDAHYLCFPFTHRPDKPPVLRGLTWKERARARAEILLDEDMTSQGSCWVMSRPQWGRIGPLDREHYGPFVSEFQEIGMTTWLGDGRVMVNKKTWYAHWYKREGQGYAVSARQNREGLAYNLDYWFNDRWAGRQWDFEWLIKRFWPVPSWPENWRDWQHKDEARPTARPAFDQMAVG